MTEGYDNAKSDIIRYCVYVETDYDTDADGKRDLVKALVQIPRAAMEGDYKAASIYEARPYITGCTSGEAPYGKDGYDLDQMYSQPCSAEGGGNRHHGPGSSPGRFLGLVLLQPPRGDV